MNMELLPLFERILGAQKMLFFLRFWQVV